MLVLLRTLVLALPFAALILNGGNLQRVALDYAPHVLASWRTADEGGGRAHKRLQNLILGRKNNSPITQSVFLFEVRCFHSRHTRLPRHQTAVAARTVMRLPPLLWSMFFRCVQARLAGSKRPPHPVFCRRYRSLPPDPALCGRNVTNPSTPHPSPSPFTRGRCVSNNFLHHHRQLLRTDTNHHHHQRSSVRAVVPVLRVQVVEASVRLLSVRGRGASTAGEIFGGGGVDLIHFCSRRSRLAACSLSPWC